MANIANFFMRIPTFFDHFFLILGGVPRHMRVPTMEQHTHNNRFWRGFAILLGSAVGSVAIANFWLPDHLWLGLVIIPVIYWIFDIALMVTWNGKKWTKKAIPLIAFRLFLSFAISYFSTTVVMLWVYSADVQKTVAVQKEKEVAEWRQQITTNTARIRGDRQARISAVETSIREVDAKIAQAGNNPCEGMTRRRACEAATSANATALEGLNAQKAQLQNDLKSAQSTLLASSEEVNNINAPIQARIDEVMSRVDGGFADKNAILDEVKKGREIQFWVIYFIVFALEFLGFIVKIFQPEDEVDIAVVTQNVTFDRNMQAAIDAGRTNTPPASTNTALTP